jgi:hypothetical protein
MGFTDRFQFGLAHLRHDDGEFVSAATAGTVVIANFGPNRLGDAG